MNDKEKIEFIDKHWDNIEQVIKWKAKKTGWGNFHYAVSISGQDILDYEKEIKALEE